MSRSDDSCEGSRCDAANDRRASGGRWLRSVELLGVRVDAVSEREAVLAIRRMWELGEAGQVVTLNPEFVVRAQREPVFRDILNRSALSTVDGVGVALAVGGLYRRRAQRVTGADLAPKLAAEAAEYGAPVYFLGAAQGVASAAAEELRRQTPGLVVAGVSSGASSPAGDDEAVEAIVHSGARLLLVAFGAPAQEYWIARNLPRLGPCVAIGVGGTFDYLAGVVPRAPRPMRAAGFEWLYRLVRQPSRWRRQLALPIFAYLVLRQCLSRQATGA